ncbi:MAG: D-alanyl-D-alanine carboxypeptidase, partial [Prevotella sp.]|nr:D-alanyl-D-alanine carboxypeptidase [Prevotella sp.]
MTDLKIWVIGLLLSLCCLQGAAQTDFEIESDSVSDSIATDTLKADSVALPWPESVVYHINRLLTDDMFQTSQVGIMVYDLTADSAIYRHNERQL